MDQLGKSSTHSQPFRASRETLFASKSPTESMLILTHLPPAPQSMTAFRDGVLKEFPEEQ